MPLVKKTFTSESYRAFLLVEKECHGMRLDLYVCGHTTPFSREMVKKKISMGEITIPGTGPRQAEAPHERSDAERKFSSSPTEKNNP